jgi:Tol biopolymer transport system component
MAGGKLLALSAAIVSCCPLLLVAQKPPKPSKPGGGDSSAAAIAYEAQNRSGSWDLMVMTASGGSQTRLVTGGDNRTPSWSPDGEWIAFSRTNVAEPGIYMVRADGTGLCRIVATDAWPFGAPAWSPEPINGVHKIVFVQRPGGQGNTDVYATDAVCNAAAAQQLTSTPTYLESYPAWSVNDVLAVGADADGIHLYNISEDGMGGLALDGGFNLTAQTALAGAVVNAPTWTADGASLVVTAAFQSLFDHWVVSTTGPGYETQRLTETASLNEGRVSWSPDFSRFVYDINGKEIYSVSVETDGSWSLGTPARVATVKGGTSGLFRPSWRPAN